MWRHKNILSPLLFNDDQGENTYNSLSEMRTQFFLLHEFGLQIRKSRNFEILEPGLGTLKFQRNSNRWYLKNNSCNTFCKRFSWISLVWGLDFWRFPTPRMTLIYLFVNFRAVFCSNLKPNENRKVLIGTGSKILQKIAWIHLNNFHGLRLGVRFMTSIIKFKMYHRIDPKQFQK